jgi:predicted ATP-grasp superfamily ATP-dependent carboligase
MALVLVTDGEQRSALAVVRSLGRAGHRVLVVSSSGRSVAGASRYAAAEERVPDPLADPAGFADEVARLVHARGVQVLVPIGEAALLALLPCRARLGPCVMPFADVERFRAVSDKVRLLEAAAASGIAVPEQRVVASAADAGRGGLAGLGYPVVVKPGRSVADAAAGGRRKFGVRHAASAAELGAVLADLPDAAFPAMIQQRVVGPGVGIFLLLWDGEPAAVFAHRRIREKPPSGGVSVYRESIPADPDLVRRSSDLLQRFGWEGVAMVEYKLEEKTGIPYLMEINGRFWGSLQLALDAGVDFPALLVAHALGDHPAPVRAYRTGVRSRWWLGDLDHLLARLRRSPGALALPPGAPGRLRALLEFLVLWRPGDLGEVFRWSDPRPGIRELGEWLRGR